MTAEPVEWIRPGPRTITPGGCPGGVVLHVYGATVPPVLLFVRRYGLDDDTAAGAELDAALAGAMGYPAVCLVGFDGDTGARYTADEWRRRP